ncbi:MAG: GGDEF domain-containing protein [Dehalococcoidia bacterium]
MTAETELAEPRGEAVSDGPPPEILSTDFISDVRRVKRFTQVGVYTTIVVTEPFYYFFLDYTALQVVIGVAIGLVIATTAIELAFGQLYKLRKRSAYPGAVALHLGAMPAFDSACQSVLTILEKLLTLRGAFLALRNNGEFLSLTALSNVSRVDADRYLRLCAGSIQEAVGTSQVVAFHPANDLLAGVVVSEGDQIVFVPVQSFQKTMGVLGLVAERSNSELGDPELLISLGRAIGVSLDSQRQRAELRTLAAIDELTKVYNRHYFFDQLDREIAAATRYSMPFSILIFDLDDLKRINDSLGHEVGDDALRSLAQRLVRYSRASDVVARLGGDEFSVILPHTDARGAAEIAQRLQTSVETEVVPSFSDQRLKLAVSCGFATFPNDAGDANALLRQADGRMYAAKAARYRTLRKRRR